MQGRVAVAVCHVDDMAQDLGGHGREGRQVVPHHGRDRRLLAGHAEPLVLQGVQAEPLPKHQARPLVLLFIDSLGPSLVQPKPMPSALAAETTAKPRAPGRPQLPHWVPPAFKLKHIVTSLRGKEPCPRVDILALLLMGC